MIWEIGEDVNHRYLSFSIWD